MQHEAGGAAGRIGGDDNVIEEGVQEFLAVAVGGGRRGPQRGQVGGDGKDLGPLVGAEPDGPGGFAAVQLGFGCLGGLQRGFPLGLQAAGDQPVLRVDGAVAALGPGGGVAGLLGLPAPLVQRGIVAGLDLVGGIQRGLQRQRGEDVQDVLRDGRVGAQAADPGAGPALPAADQHAAVALVAGDGLGGAAVEHAEAAPADPQIARPCSSAQPSRVAPVPSAPRPGAMFAASRAVLAR